MMALMMARGAMLAVAVPLAALAGPAAAEVTPPLTLVKMARWAMLAVAALLGGLARPAAAQVTPPLSLMTIARGAMTAVAMLLGGHGRPATAQVTPPLSLMTIARGAMTAVAALLGGLARPAAAQVTPPLSLMTIARGATLAVAALLGSLAVPAAAQVTPPLTLVATIRLPNTAGRIDHLGIDLKRQRLFVAELGNGTVDVINLADQTVLYRIAGLRDPQGVLYVPQADRLAVASAGDGTVRFYAGDTYEPRGVVPLGDDADNLRLDPRNGLVVAGHGGGGLAVIDPATPARIKDIRLPAHPEGFQIAAVTRRAYVNVPDVHQINVVDLATGKLAARWPLPHVAGNFPLALGESNIAAVVTRSPPRFLRLAIDAAATRSANDACGDADDVFFDARRQRYYVSCGAGSVDTFQLSADGVQALARTATASGARTSLFVPELDRLFVAVRAAPTDANASIRVFRPSP